MAPRKLIEANLFLIDWNSNNRDKLKRCFFNIVSTKFFVKESSNKEDMYKLFIIGISETDNSLKYKNIKCVSDWQHYGINGLNNLFKDDYQPAPVNIFEALSLAALHLESDEIMDKSYSKRIVLLSDLSSSLLEYPQRDKNIMQLKDNLITQNIWLFVLGPNVKTPYLETIEDVMEWSTNVQPVLKFNQNQEELFGIVKKLLKNGLMADFETGFHLLLCYKSQEKPPFPWYADMQIGSSLSFKINVIKLVHDAPNIKLHNVTNDGEVVETPQKQWYDPNTNETVDSDEVVKGYRVQSELVVISAEREKERSERERNNSPKCFEIFGFIDAAQAPTLYYDENSISRVVADTRNEDHTRALDVLTVAMRDLNIVALVKRIYNNGPQFVPKPHVLFPCPDHEYCLLLVQWPNQTDIIDSEGHKKGSEFKPKTENSELKSAVYGFLDSMTAGRDDFCEDGKVISCLSDDLKQDPFRVSQYEYLVEESWKTKEEIEKDEQEDGERVRHVKDLHVHPILEERSKPYVELIQDLCPNKSDLDDPSQCPVT